MSCTFLMKSECIIVFVSSQFEGSILRFCCINKSSGENERTWRNDQIGTEVHFATISFKSSALLLCLDFLLLYVVWESFTKWKAMLPIAKDRIGPISIMEKDNIHTLRQRGSCWNPTSLLAESSPSGEAPPTTELLRMSFSTLFNSVSFSPGRLSTPLIHFRHFLQSSLFLPRELESQFLSGFHVSFRELTTRTNFPRLVAW